MSKKSTMREPDENVWVRLPSKELETLEHRCIDLRISRPEGIRRAIGDWLDAAKRPGNEAFQKLDVIMNGDDENAKVLIQRNIDFFLDRLLRKSPVWANLADIL